MDAISADQKFLKAKGAADHVVQGGSAGLLENWEKVVAAVRQGYPFGLEDYLNDMDGRQLLEETLAVLPERERIKFQERLEQNDNVIRSLVKPTDHCLWGDRTAQKEGWTREKNWWYFSIPLHADSDLLSEIQER
jgi:hypothetical protein